MIPSVTHHSITTPDGRAEIPLRIAWKIHNGRYEARQVQWSDPVKAPTKETPKDDSGKPDAP